MRTSRGILVAALVAALVAIAGCGGSSNSSSGVSANAYVKSVCSAVGPFEKDVQARSSALNVSSLTSPSQGKQALQGFMQAVVADADRAISSLKSAGSPKINNGKSIAAAIVKAFTELRAALAQAQTQTNSLPTSSATAFKAAAQTLGASIRASVSGIGQGLSGLKSPELEKAARSTPACQTLGA